MISFIQQTDYISKISLIGLYILYIFDHEGQLTHKVLGGNNYFLEESVRGRIITHLVFHTVPDWALVNLRLHLMSHSLARSQGIFFLYCRQRERETKAEGSKMICLATQGVNSMLRIVFSCTSFHLQWPVIWDFLSHFLVIVIWLGVTFRDYGGFYWKCLFFSENHKSLFFYSSQIFILNSLEDIGKKLDIYKLISIMS